jgi:hypothetical protein
LFIAELRFASHWHDGGLAGKGIDKRQNIANSGESAAIRTVGG